MKAEAYHIYIDESCHTPNNGSDVMCIGAIIVSESNYKIFKNELQKIKLEEKTPTEVKWNSLNNNKKQLYARMVDYFFANDIEFRSVLIKNKSIAEIKDDRDDKNSFYYKSLIELLKNIAAKSNCNYKVYLDFKDTRGKQRLKLLKEELEAYYQQDYPFESFKHIHSDESIFLQLADMFIGAMCFKARGMHLRDNASSVRKELITQIEQMSGYDLADGSEPWEKKFFILDFKLKP